MAIVSFNIPDDIITRVRNALAARGGWTPESGDTKAEFARKEMARMIKQATVDWEASQDAETARQAKRIAAEAEIIIT